MGEETDEEWETIVVEEEGKEPREFAVRKMVVRKRTPREEDFASSSSDCRRGLRLNAIGKAFVFAVAPEEYDDVFKDAICKSVSVRLNIDNKRLREFLEKNEVPNEVIERLLETLHNVDELDLERPRGF